MALYQIKIIETLVVIIGYFTAHYVTKIFVNNTLKQTHLLKSAMRERLKNSKKRMETARLVAAWHQVQ